MWGLVVPGVKKQLSLLTDLTYLDVPDKVSLEYVRLFPKLEAVYNFGARDADLVFLKDLSRVKVLGIESAEITDAGVEHLAKLSSLEQMYPYETKISEDGFAKLQRAFPPARLFTDLAPLRKWSVGGHPRPS